MQPNDFQQKMGITDDVLVRLKTYHALLLKWQKAINLVSPKTLDHAWERHFYDSAQLTTHIPKDTKVIADLGSGAGFPGLVLAILQPNIEIHLIESDNRKCEFLKTVSRETGAACIIHNKRIEDTYEAITPDLITARALAPIETLLTHCAPWHNRNKALSFMFLKGEQASLECKKARDHYAFNCTFAPSVTENNAQIALIKNVTLLDVHP